MTRLTKKSFLSQVINNLIYSSEDMTLLEEKINKNDDLLNKFILKIDGKKLYSYQDNKSHKRFVSS